MSVVAVDTRLASSCCWSTDYECHECVSSRSCHTATCSRSVSNVLPLFGRVTVTSGSSKNGAVTLSRMNLSGCIL